MLKGEFDKMGGENYYLAMIGDTVVRERKKRNMTQKEFYEFLFPDSNLDDKSIKSWMNNVEHGRRKTIDPDLLYLLHEKCNLGMDNIFGYETEFPNHENENASRYTGLSTEATELLHGLAVAFSAEIPPLEECKDDKSYELRCKIRSDKQDAEWILMILEVLLSEDIQTSDQMLPNYNILFDLYMLSATEPESLKGIIKGTVSDDDGLMEVAGKYEELYVDGLYMHDSFGFSHTINIDEVHQQIWKNKLNGDIERFISIIKSKELNKKQKKDNRLFQ